MHQNLPLERRNQGDLASVTRPETSTLGDRLDELDVGQTERVERTITAADVAAFAALSGDFNALHVDPEFAARTEFGQPVAHGFLHASLLSNLVGMKIPGPGALYLSQSIEFSAPVFIGDRLEARATIESIDRDTRIVTLATETLNQKGVPVMRGKARVTLGGETHEVGEGAWVRMPAGLPHSVYALTPLTMQLTLLPASEVGKGKPAKRRKPKRKK